MLLRPFLNDAGSCASYLFGCTTHAELAVVDPHADLVDARRERTKPARESNCRWCEVLATLWSISVAISSTERSPWASTSTISARRPLPSAWATEANASKRAAFAVPLISSNYHLNI